MANKKEKKRNASTRKKVNLDLPMDSSAILSTVNFKNSSILSPKQARKKSLNTTTKGKIKFNQSEIVSMLKKNNRDGLNLSTLSD